MSTISCHVCCEIPGDGIINVVDYRVDWDAVAPTFPSPEALGEARKEVFTALICNVCLEDPPEWFIPLCFECGLDQGECKCVATHSIIEGDGKKSLL